jgi:hypothetical protein
MGAASLQGVIILTYFALRAAPAAAITFDYSGLDGLGMVSVMPISQECFRSGRADAYGLLLVRRS